MKFIKLLIILSVIGAGLAVAFIVGEALRRTQPALLDEPDFQLPDEQEAPLNSFLPEPGESVLPTVTVQSEDEQNGGDVEIVLAPTGRATPEETPAAEPVPIPTLEAESTQTPDLEISEPPDLLNNPSPGIDPQDPHRFIMNGESWYPAGYYPAIAALTADQTDYQNYYRLFIDKLAENNINLFRNVFTMGQPYGESMTPYQRTGPGEAADNRPRFDLDLFNQAYFDYWREVISYANTKGVVVQLTIFDNWHNKSYVVHAGGGLLREWGMKHDFYNGTNNINGIDASNLSNWHDLNHPVNEYQKALIRQVVDNLSDLPNIIYEISNENYTSERWELALADYLSEYEVSRGLPAHLVMPRDLPNHDSAGGKTNDPYIVHQELVQNFSLNQPLIADNDGGGHVNPEGRRKKAWAVLTAGGHINYFHFELFKIDVLNSQDSAEGMRYIGFTRKFLDDFQIDLRGMVPADNLVSSGWSFARAGESYIVYLINGGTTEVERLPEEFSAYWFNPRDGSNMPAEGGPLFTSPDGHDWVLYITAR
jgi:hypothetical protein